MNKGWVQEYRMMSVEWVQQQVPMLMEMAENRVDAIAETYNMTQVRVINRTETNS